MPPPRLHWPKPWARGYLAKPRSPPEVGPHVCHSKGQEGDAFTVWTMGSVTTQLGHCSTEQPKQCTQRYACASLSL